MMTTRKVLTVSELTRQVKLILEDEIGAVHVAGEISNWRQMPSGHCYMTLKDEGAQLNAVLFAGARRGVKFQPADGMAVRATGEITVYEPRGQYQLIVRKLESAGQGALMERFEALKRKLAAEGLFDEDRKQPLPLLPRHIGVVTSPGGAALRDIVNVLSRRYPNLRVLVAGTRVQGAGAAEEIAAAIDLLNAVGTPERLPDSPPLDVLIVTRGGGSIEDLWAFNEEVVARAVARSRLPVISAVGHEIDFTICDFASDLRAPTPSAAAELVVGHKEDFERRLAMNQRAMDAVWRQRLTEVRGRMLNAAGNRVFSEPRHAITRLTQRLDSVANRLRATVDERCLSDRRRCERALSILLYQRGVWLPQRRNELRDHQQRIGRATDDMLAARESRLVAIENRLHALNPLAVLARGFSLTQLEDGTIVRDADQAPPGTNLVTRLAHGRLHSVASRNG